MPEHGGLPSKDRVQRLFSQVDIVRGRWRESDDQYRSEPYAITQRAIDEAQTAGYRLYTSAGSLIAAALDNLDALRVLLQQDGGGVGPWAPYNLVRGAFLPAVWAIWMLEPADSRERRIRGLRFAVVDEREWESFRSAFTSTANQAAHWTSRHIEVSKTYRDEADDLGLQWSIARTPINLVQELPKLHTLRSVSGDSIAAVVGLWRGMSGIAHGYGYAVQALSDVQIKQKTSAGAAVTAFLNDERFSGTALLAGAVVVSAMSLYQVRSCEIVQGGI